MLDSQLMPSRLRLLSKAALLGNTTRIFTAQGQTREIAFAAGVAQGEPLSPALFNLAIDNIVDRLDSGIVRLSYGYSDEDGACSVLSFADDTTLTSNSMQSMQQLLNLAYDGFREIGLQLNACKTRWLIADPSFEVDPLELNIGDQKLTPAADATLSRYLGACFSPQQAFNGADIIVEFDAKLQNILDTSLLYTSQKLQIAKQYLFPILNYSFQITPAHLVAEKWLNDLDKIVTSFLRELLLLPNGTCNAFYYTAQAKRGLAVPRYTWESRLQRLSALPTIYTSTHSQELQATVMEEARRCFGSVQVETPVENEIFMPNLSTRLRKLLRERSFAEWCALPYAGRGAQLYADVPAGNRWLSKKFPLDQKQWLTAIKLTTNACSVLSHPAINRGVHPRLCRRGCNADETIGHILGECKKNNGLIVDRHNEVVRCIAQRLREQNYTVHEEVRCVGDEEQAESGRPVQASRRVDIVAIYPDRSKVVLLDPTVRIERDEISVQDALKEKQTIYTPTINFFRDRYEIHDIRVVGIWFGARGAQHSTTVETFKQLGLLKGRSTALLDDITKIILRHSTAIMNNHLSCNVS